MTARRTLVTLFVSVLAAVLPATALATGRPSGMSTAAYRALVAHGRALNTRYGNAVTRLSAKEFGELYLDGGSKMSPEALNALIVRSQAMNQQAAAQFHGLPPAAYAALVARGRALDARYGNALTRLTPRQFTELYQHGGSKLTPQALNALIVRSEALNKLARTTTPATPPATTNGPSFAWDDFGIGMAAAFGLVLLTGGLAVAVRTGRRSQIGVTS